MIEKSNISPTGSDRGKVIWTSPSNIALVKYWGKRGNQIPANPSLSMTLERSVTFMEMSYERDTSGKQGISLDFYFEGTRNRSFEEKIVTYLRDLSSREEFSWLDQYHLDIRSRNTFPHSAGIASSASSMSALALCLLSARQEIVPERSSEDNFLPEASDLARLASGSACRSVYGGYALWGTLPEVEGSSDNYAVPVAGQVHPAFRDFNDAILIVSSDKKSVSSRAGHGLMNGHPFSQARYEMASQNASYLLSALKSGDYETYIRITEQEALTLHALMMSSNEPFILLQPASLMLMDKIRRFRHDTGLPVCFTIDAGPNIHLLYPRSSENDVRQWIKSELIHYLEEGQWMEDGIGQGPVKLIE